MATPTRYTYTLDAETRTAEAIEASTGIVGASVVHVPVPQFEVTTADVLSEFDKGNLDQFFTDRGYSFTGKAP